MRQIVIGQFSSFQGIQTINVWFRFQVSNANRQAFYTKQFANYQPQAPGDYTATTGTDFAEIAQFQSGQWVERAGFTDVLDPTSGTTTVETRLANIYTAAASNAATADNTSLAYYGTNWSGGTSWTIKSA